MFFENLLIPKFPIMIFVACLYAMLPHLTDGNGKVNLHALKAFSNVVRLLCELLLLTVTI